MKKIILFLILVLFFGGQSYAVELDENNDGATDVAHGGTGTTDGSILSPNITVDGIYSTNKTSNYDFDANTTGWTVQTGWSWESDGAGGGRLRHTAGNEGYVIPTGLAEPVPGHIYKVVFTSGGQTAGTMNVGIGGVDIYGITGNGEHTLYFKAVSGSAFGVQGSSTFNGYIDSLKYYELASGGSVTADDSILLRAGSIKTVGGSYSYPAIALTDYPNTGFFRYGDSWAYSQGGVKQIQFTSEDSTAGLLRGFGSNRFTIEAWNALVLRAQNNHFELEGSTSSTGIEIVPYRAGSSQGIPLTFKTDVTLPAAFVVKVDGNFSTKPGASVTPENNGELVFEATSNTSVTVKLKGSDGTVRSAVLTLAP